MKLYTSYCRNCKEKIKVGYGMPLLRIEMCHKCIKEHEDESVIKKETEKSEPGKKIEEYKIGKKDDKVEKKPKSIFAKIKTLASKKSK